MKVKKLIFLSILISCLNNEIKAQATSTSHFGTLPTDWCGWNALSTVPFNLEHRGTLDINFLTGGVQRMKINGTAVGPNQGFVAIGPGTANNRLDVFAGDIDVNQPRRSYMIADLPVLWHKASDENIFVGVGAGQTQGFNLAARNTYVGKNAGFSGTGALTPGAENNENVIVGWNAGFNNLSQRATIVGVEAGFNSLNGAHTLVGYRAGFSFTGFGGSSTNTFIGYESGFAATNVHNTFVGFHSGRNSTSGDRNSFLGNFAGSNNSTGIGNCFFGWRAGTGNGAFSRNVYIGHNAGTASVGDENIFIGEATGTNGGGTKNIAMGSNAFGISTIGNENIAIGNLSNQNGQNNNFNSFFGAQSAPVLVNSDLNTFVGYKAAFNQTSGFNNTYLGETTGNNVQTGTNNTFLGSKADATNVTPILNNAAAIGANAKVTNDNHMILGDNNVNVGIGLSADPAGPGNKLEINTAAATPIPGASGLRFTDLNSTSTAITNPGTGVLSVDASGDVIYVPAGGSGTGFGGVCGTTPAGLTSDWEIPLKNFNYVFSGQGLPLTGNNVGIGTTCTPLAKLHVNQSSGSTMGSIGILVENTDQASVGSPNPIIGIKSIVSNPSTLNCFKAAGWFEATPAPNCVGTIDQWAIVVPNNGGLVSIGYSPPSPASMMDVNGSVRSMGIVLTSDISLKNSINTLPNSLNLIKRLRPVTFKWNTFTDSMAAGTHAGFIAQEVDTVIPQVVRTTNTGIKNIAYTELIPYLVSAIQSQQKTIDSLKIQMAALTSSVTSCCSSSAIRQTPPSEQNQLAVNLSDKDIIVLNQNVPNPFAEQTTITYNVPEKYGYAQMIFSTIDGRVLKTVDITKKGKGTLTVFSNDLSSGMYTYSLIVDGKTFDTKKMVKSE